MQSGRRSAVTDEGKGKHGHRAPKPYSPGLGSAGSPQKCAPGWTGVETVRAPAVASSVFCFPDTTHGLRAINRPYGTGFPGWQKIAPWLHWKTVRAPIDCAPLRWSTAFRAGNRRVRGQFPNQQVSFCRRVCRPDRLRRVNTRRRSAASSSSAASRLSSWAMERMAFASIRRAAS
jgi:hypothetical protein